MKRLVLALLLVSCGPRVPVASITQLDYDPRADLCFQSVLGPSVWRISPSQCPDELRFDTALLETAKREGLTNDDYWVFFGAAVYYAPEFNCQTDDDSAQITGCCDPGTGTIAVRAGRFIWEERRTLQHELTHLLRARLKRPDHLDAEGR